MATDRWGETVHTEGGWAVSSDRYTTIRVGGEFDPKLRSAIFYEDNLPELRLFTWLLLDNLAMQERSARKHGREVSDKWRDALLEKLDRLRAELSSTQPTPDTPGDQGGAEG